MSEIYTINITAIGPCRGTHSTQAFSEKQAVRNLCHRLCARQCMSKSAAVVYTEHIISKQLYEVISRQQVLPESGFSPVDSNIPTVDALDKDMQETLDRAKKSFEGYTLDPDDVDEGTYSEKDQ